MSDHQIFISESVGNEILLLHMSTSLPSYVICNGYGDVLRSSASIAKSNSEVIAQVRQMISLDALLFEFE